MLLLVVLSLLVLFLMVGTAFVISAKQAEKSGKSAYKGAVRVADEEARGRLLDNVLLQLVRDTNNPSSALRFHSLLGDMYGADGFRAQITGAAWAAASNAAPGANPTGGQMMQFQVDLSPSSAGGLPPGLPYFRDLYGIPLSASGALSPVDNAYNGLVLTFVNGVCAEQSTRIVGYRPANPTASPPQAATFTILAPPLPGGGTLTDPTMLNGNSSTGREPVRIVVNGRPFGGTGFGFDPSTLKQSNVARLTLTEQIAGVSQRPPLALLPNMAFFNANLVASNNGTLTPSLLLNPSQRAAGTIPAQQAALAAQIGPAGIGGANESYDAVDYQNMALALLPGTDRLWETVLPDASVQAPLPTVLATNDGVPMVIPSFHRPELINYWAQQGNDGAPRDIRNSPLASSPQQASMLRRILLRPNWWDHPNFTGSNPEYGAAVAAAGTGTSRQYGQALARMVYGPWDVDNDNDGARDSIWIDAGLPVMMGPHGKLVKPLAAILCVDMDGRLNVNAHGTVDLARGVSDVATDVRLADGTAAAPEADDTPRGAGWGPGDISLAQALNPGLTASYDANNPNDVYRLMTGVYEPGHPQAGQPVVGGGEPAGPGRYGYMENSVVRAGRGNYADLSSQISMFGWPERANWLSKFGLPPDLRARYGVGVNVFGQPVFEATLDSEIQDPNGNLLVDSPYEINLSQSAVTGVTGQPGQSPADLPFSLAELERALRIYDADSGSLPGRLAYLSGILNTAGSGAPDLSDRMKLTTDSFDLPTPSVGVPPAMVPGPSTLSLYSAQVAQGNMRLPRSTAELIEIRVRAALRRNNAGGANYTLFPDPINDPNVAAQVRGVMRQILAPELADGLRLDVNRALGNGRDDNNNGIVDEAGELDGSGAATSVWPALNKGGAAVAAADAYSGPAGPRFPVQATDVTAAGALKGVDHRQLLARHLYVLALTLTADPAYGDPGQSQQLKDADAELARRTAQWAVNVVDFRDADNAMTMFEYDVNPFDGWDVDGIVGGSPQSQDDSNPMRGLVFGCEKPELLMTETLAWHDRRTDDSAQASAFPSTDGPDTTTTDTRRPDKDFDQLSRPRGAFFLEVYNPSANSPSAGADTHAVAVRRNNRIDLGVNLAAVAIDPNDVSRRSPVWRLAIYKRGSTPEEEAAAWDPDDVDVKKRPRGQMDRSVYLAGFDPKYPDDGVAFFNDRQKNPAPPVRPGRYMVIGAGDETAPGVYEAPIGDRKGARNPNSPNKGPKRRIELVTRNTAGGNPTVRLVDADNAAVDDVTVQPQASQYKVQAPREATIQSPPQAGQPALATPAFPGDASGYVADVAIVDRVQDGTTGNTVKRRLSLSEPAVGYPNRFRGSQWNDAKDQYEAADSTLMPIDVPLDGPIGGEAALQNQFGNDMSTWPSYLASFDNTTRKWSSLVDPVLTQIRDPQPDSNPNPGASYSFIYLQRLADPTKVWNPEPGRPGHDPNRPVNPYLTVDATSANLTVFNSRGSASGEEEDGSPANNARAKFASHERGFTQANTQNSAPPLLWSEEAPSLVRMRNPRFKIRLLPAPRNRFFDPPFRNQMNLADTSNYWFNAVPYCSLGFMNKPFEDATRAGELRQLVPARPFPWFAWNNRPYVSGNEVMLAPRVRSSQLMRQFLTAETGGAAPQQGRPSSYVTPLASEFDAPQPPTDQQPAYAHLENLFFEQVGNGQISAAQLRRIPNGLYRVLEYLHTPSLFAGTSKWLNPGTAQFGGFDPTAPTASADDPRMHRQPPFNEVSEFRDPGRINLNTIFSRDVWDGMFHGRATRDGSRGVATHTGPDFDDEFVVSRRAYGGTVDKTLLLDASSPTFFANPFRSPDAGDLAPLPSMRRTGVDCTLLRSMQGTAGGVQTGPKAGGDPLFAAIDGANSANPWRGAMRNAAFRYGPMVRLDNLVTTRSNVYAVWVTIGFFEVADAPAWSSMNAQQQAAFGNSLATYNRVYPDGYQFGKEDGVETGDIRRMRSFYIIDRSLPAAFEPGADHNVENVIRLRRRIE